jgi:hypothetical protein
LTDSVSQDKALASIGRAVIISQSVETALRLITTFVFQGPVPLTLESLGRQEAQERRNTIGYFVQSLKRRVAIREDFEELLTSFLESRNTLVHRTSEIEGWNLKIRMDSGLRRPMPMMLWRKRADLC